MTARLFRPDVLLDDTGAREDHALLVADGRIAAVGPADLLAAQHPDAETVGLADRALLPGTVNAHSHSFQSLLRGVAEDGPYAAWLAALYRYAPAIGVEAAYAGALFAFGEMLLRGVTTVVDFFYLHHGSNERALAVATAARELGIRLVLARSMYDARDAPPAFVEDVATAVRNTRALADALRGDELVRVVPAPHSPHAASAEMIRAGAALAREMGVPWHIHVAESEREVAFTRERYGATPLAWLSSLGVLDERTVIVHGVNVTDVEVALLAKCGGMLVHCPSSNLLLGDGVAPLSTYLAAGVPVALGCDSGSASDRLSIFAEMRMAVLLQRGVRRGAVTARQALAMGTRSGARATGLRVGALEPSAFADLVALDLADLSLAPVGHLERTVVYSHEPTAIRQVYVGGDEVVRDAALARVDAERIRDVIASAVPP